MLRAASAAVLAAVSFQIAACSAENEEVTAIEKAEALMTSACTATGEQAFTVWSVQPDPGVDYFAFREEVRDESRWEVTLREEHGALCATATDQEACKRKVAALRELTETCEDLPKSAGCRTSYFVATRGDEVWVASENAEIAKLAGRIDVPSEAFGAAWRARNYQLVCAPESVPPRWRAVDDGYEIIAEDSTCEAHVHVRFEVLLHVHADGRVEELARKEFSRATEEYTCVPMPTR
ncbi:MAG: hypothetical protein U0270_23605 [Labilithrix sp.]